MRQVISDGGASVAFCSDQFSVKRVVSLQAVQGSASISGNMLCATMVNSHPCDEIDVELALVVGTLRDAELVRLQTTDIHAHNTFESPDRVALSQSETALVPGNVLRVKLPAASILRVMGRLG